MLTPRRSRARHRARLTAATLGAALALTACASAPDTDSGAGDAPPASFVYDVGSGTAAVTMAPYTAVPEELGYWSDANLEVSVVYSDGSSAALQSLLGGRADIVVSGSNATYSTAVENPDLRIVSFTPENVWRIAVSSQSEIAAVEDLKGAVIGVISLTSGSYTYGRSIVQSAGLDPDEDVTWLPVGTGSQAVEAIESGRVSAYSSYDGPLDVVAQLTQDGLVPLGSPLDEVAGSLAYVVTKQTLEERPDDIVRFLRGTYQGMEFTRNNPEAAVQIYWSHNPDQQPAGDDLAADIAEAVEVTQNSWSNRATPGDDGIWGFLSPARVQQAAQFFMDYRIVEGDADPELTVDLTLTQEASEFDVAPIIEQAVQWTPAS